MALRVFGIVDCGGNCFGDCGGYLAAKDKREVGSIIKAVDKELFRAIVDDDVDAVTACVARGIDVLKARNAAKQTPMQVAKQRGSVQVHKYLSEHKVKYLRTMADTKKVTPLTKKLEDLVPDLRELQAQVLAQGERLKLHRSYRQAARQSLESRLVVVEGQHRELQQKENRKLHSDAGDHPCMPDEDLVPDLRELQAQVLAQGERPKLHRSYRQAARQSLESRLVVVKGQHRELQQEENTKLHSDAGEHPCMPDEDDLQVSGAQH